MHEAYGHGFLWGTEAAYVFDGVAQGLQFVLQFVGCNVVWDAFQNDLKGAFFRERKCVEFSFVF